MAKKCPHCKDLYGNNTLLGYIINGHWMSKENSGYSPELEKVYTCFNCHGLEFK